MEYEKEKANKSYFSIGLIVFPIGFIIGQLGSIFYFLKRKKIKQD